MIIKNTKKQVLHTTVVRNGQTVPVAMPGKSTLLVDGLSALSDAHVKNRSLVVQKSTANRNP